MSLKIFASRFCVFCMKPHAIPLEDEPAWTAVQLSPPEGARYHRCPACSVEGRTEPPGRKS